MKCVGCGQLKERTTENFIVLQGWNFYSNCRAGHENLCNSTEKPCKECFNKMSKIDYNTTDGFVKVIFDAKYGEFLGAHMIGTNVTEMIAEVVVARKLETRAQLVQLLDRVQPLLRRLGQFLVLREGQVSISTLLGSTDTPA